MKPIITILLLSVFSLTYAQTTIESTGFPGDHFSLEGALDLFKKSKSPEDFEKKLNQNNSEVNNLDLNEDGEVDYIKVIDNTEGDVHAIVLRVPVNEKESQDVAVIEIEKTGKESAILQIVGNEDVFGEELIAEPFQEEVSGTKGKGPNAEDYYRTRIVVNVWLWPCVTYVYAPGYRVWRSPWRWRHYPRWWSPWRPVTWAVFSVHHARWRPHYHRVTTHRVVRAHKVYTPRRATSVTVAKRTTVIRSNRVATKKSTTVINRNGNNTTAVKKTTKAGAVKNGDNVKVGKKTTTVGAKKTDQGVKVGKKTTKAGVKSDGQTTTAKKKTTKAGLKKSGNRTVAGKKSTKTTAKKKGNTKAAKRTTKTKRVKKKKG